MKKWFKKKGVTQQTPRPMEEIKKNYQAAATHAGGLQYEIEVKKAELSNLNNTLLQLNQEADARNKLDAEAAKAMKEKNEQPKQ